MIHAEAGDTILVWLRNMLAAPVNLEPMGNSWSVATLLQPIQSGMVAKYTIDVPLSAGPPAGSEQSSTLYFYRSTLNPTFNENTGLVGPLIITRKGDANADGTPKGVDREFVTVYQVRVGGRGNACASVSGVM